MSSARAWGGTERTKRWPQRATCGRAAAGRGRSPMEGAAGNANTASRGTMEVWGRGRGG